MKKTLLATAIVSALVASTAASAATVYDKDGTTLKVNARIEAQWYNAGSSMNYSGEKAPGNNDSSIYNWARMGLDGRSKINNYMTAFGYMEFDVADGDNKKDGMSARDQYIGVDFGSFGAVKTGRYKSLMNTVVGATDVLPGDGVSGKAYIVGNDRAAGKLTYTWNGYGVLLGAEYQSAKNEYTDGAYDKKNIEGGYNLIAGYTTPSVLFGPISIKAGYSYMRGQDDKSVFEDSKAKGYAASLAWGVASKGLYLATEYSHVTVDQYGSEPDEDWDSVEVAVKYSFDNGFLVGTGYQYKSYEIDGGKDYACSQLPFAVEYNFNPNFKVYAQGIIGLSNDKDNTKDAWKKLGPTHGEGNSFGLGARDTF